MPPLQSFFSDADDTEVIEISDSDDETNTDDERTRRKLTALFEDTSISADSESSDDEVLGPRTRLRSARTYRDEDARSIDSSDDTLDSLCEALAEELHSLESPEDLALLYPRKFSTSSALGVALPCASEHDVLNEFIAMDKKNMIPSDEGDFYEFDLEDFSVYRSPEQPSGFKGQYENLVTVQTSKKTEQFLVDGILVHNGNRRPVRCALISTVTFGELEKLESSTTEGQIWIDTVHSSERKYYYRLRKPAAGYREHWKQFLWVANLCKYVIDFLKVKGNGVGLRDFESTFWRWLNHQHGENISSWHLQCGKKEDFRPWICQHRFFLWNTFYGLHNKHDAHSLWNELGVFDRPDNRKSQSKSEKTVVTPQIGDQFLRVFPRWRKLQLLEIVQPCPDVKAFRQQRIHKWKFPQKLAYRQERYFNKQRTSKAASILENTKADQHISLKPFELIRKVVIIRLGNRQHYELRYAFVRWASNTSIKVVWAVLPSSTLCGSEKDGTEYPIGNELFFSDQCNCEEISIQNVVRIVNVSVFSDHAKASESAELFIHCLFREKEDSFITAIEDELICYCQSRQSKKNAQSSVTRNSDIHYPKMKVLSLFAGGGLWDHSFTCSGYAEIITAVEHDEMAILSHRANYHYSRDTQYKLDSVNTVLREYLTGVGLLNHVDCLIAGCPCQGFSPLNRHPNSEGALRNCTLLANTISYIETLMPAYAVIENVPRMIERRSPNEGKQAICHLVALGYQVRKMILRAAKLGGASKRERLIIIAAAPGAVLPASIDEISEPRACSLTMANLSPVHNDTSINILDPFHIPISRLHVSLQDEISLRNVVQRIPTTPSGMSLSKAYHHGHLSPSQNTWFRSLNAKKQAKGSKSYGRLDPNKPFPTICTKIVPKSDSNGQLMHPYEHRTISLREAMRAMDLPKNFLLIGSMSQQYEILGNGVPYSIGAVLGRAVGKAWRATLSQRGTDCASSNLNEAQTPPLSKPCSNAAEPRRHKRAVVLDEEDEEDDEGAMAPPIVAPRRHKRAVVLDDSDEDEGDDGNDSDVVFVDVKPVKRNRLV
ncbi:hypothetical protein PV08_07855 [Exophiala spinifera]|uniref:DNA (cytosine-5-)-methyltransferase n=1 Tax=Exophiala spinifera TaxID=91928 RepID=A0A0D2B857_9EURO|nr:uncharacterized protein PV08_07855 [Exophiala spinifera]KIW15068.1 hypothetical protein PV08_07855 [Exophiala spinifera]